MQAAPAYPVNLDFDAPLEVARWRPLVNWLLAIPQFIVLYALNAVAQAIVFISWFAILFTGAFPRALFDFVAMTQRYQWRVTSYAVWMREPYPPFEFTLTAEDPGTDPAFLSIEYPEQLSRGLIFVKWLLAFPHYIVLFFLGIGAAFIGLASFFVVLFTGRWNQGMRDYIVGVSRWGYRVTMYVYLMRDEYPPFSLY
jgi:hypothetical protein